MADTHVLLVRHPETLANVNGRFVGRGDSAYTAVGQAQAGRLPGRIGDFGPDTVWSSPLERALRVAEQASAGSSVELRVDERLVELDFGRAEGMTYDEVMSAGLSFNYRNRDEPVAEGGESRGQVEQRAAAVCDEIVRLGGRHAVVTHGGVFRASLVHLLGLASTDIWAFHIRNAQVAHVWVSDGHGMLEEFVQV